MFIELGIRHEQLSKIFIFFFTTEKESISLTFASCKKILGDRGRGSHGFSMLHVPHSGYLRLTLSAGGSSTRVERSDIYPNHSRILESIVKKLKSLSIHLGGIQYEKRIALCDSTRNLFFNIYFPHLMVAWLKGLSGR